MNDFGVLVRIQTRLELRRTGYSRSRINEMMDACDDGVLTAVKFQVKANIPEIGEDEEQKTFWDRLKEWIRSPEGKAFIQALIQTLLMVIIGV